MPTRATTRIDPPEPRALEPALAATQARQRLQPRPPRSRRRDFLATWAPGGPDNFPRDGFSSRAGLFDGPRGPEAAPRGAKVARNLR